MPVTGVGEAGSGVAVDRDVVRSWSAAAEASDRVGLALDLAEIAGPGTRAELVGLARLRLLAQRTTAAVDAVDEAGLVEGSAEPVVLAVRAAAGDDAAYRALLVDDPAARLERAYLVGAAAEARDDRAVADQAWTVVVQGHRVLTEHSFPRWAVARIQARSRHDPAAVVGMLVDVVRAHQHLPHDLARSAAPVLDVASELARRGDVAGARLWLLAVRRLLPRSPAVEEADRRAEPPGLRRHVWTQRLLPFLPVLLLLPVAVLALLAGLLVRLALETRVRAPGLSLCDSRAWRALRSVVHDPVRQEVRSAGGGDVHILTFLVAVGAAIAGGLVGFHVAFGPAVATVLPQEGTGPLLLRLGAVLSAVVVPPAAVALAVSAVTTQVAGRRVRARLARERATQSDDLSRCGCLRRAWLTDERAAEHARLHLQELPAPAHLAAGLGRPVSVHLCPATGRVWLGLPPHGAAPGLLLRGDSVGASPAVPEPSVGQYL